VTAENITITTTTVAMGMITATTSGRDITDHATTNACVTYPLESTIQDVTYPLESTIQDRPFRLASCLDARQSSIGKPRASDWVNASQLLANQAGLVLSKEHT
jgi:hypothetical protein